jgi:predicted GTPase
MVTVVDPHRPGHELSYYPGEVNLRISDVVVINKIDSADFENIQTVRSNIARANPRALVVEAASTITVDKPEVIKGKRVLVVEDGPTLTHGEMKIGAGVVAARKLGATELVDPRPFITGKLKDTFRTYPNIGTLLPAMGYGEQQVRDLEKTIENTDCDSVVIATPVDLNRILKIKKPNTRVHYDLQEIGSPNLNEILSDFVKEKVN